MKNNVIHGLLERSSVSVELNSCNTQKEEPSYTIAKDKLT